MESLRNFLTGPRLIFVVLVCAVPFVFLGTGSLQTAFTGSFGSINGEDVTENDIQIAANSAVSRFKSIYGEYDYYMFLVSFIEPLYLSSENNLARKLYENIGVSCVIFTDIEKDGLMEGVSLNQLKILLKNTKLN